MSCSSQRLGILAALACEDALGSIYKVSMFHNCERVLEQVVKFVEVWCKSLANNLHCWTSSDTFWKCRSHISSVGSFWRIFLQDGFPHLPARPEAAATLCPAMPVSRGNDFSFHCSLAMPVSISLMFMSQLRLLPSSQTVVSRSPFFTDLFFKAFWH